MYQQYSFICKSCIIDLYICIVKIILWMCHHKTLENLKKAHDICLKQAQEESRGKAYVEDNRRLGIGCMKI